MRTKNGLRRLTFRNGMEIKRKGNKPIWTTLAEVSQACKELIKCNCRTNCMKRCRCKSQSLKFTKLCGCSGGCD